MRRLAFAVAGLPALGLGFAPEVRALSLKSGCTGQVDLALKIGPAVGQR